ncbi:decaprenyl-phosphate phosphoribosyltransferase [Geotalea sp. SG265]|uniref:decaprenyl-phosphate phosphoribosyltransferase n=1 Tax=Geotalea sp. SG265 TaxID=2922867 RepID=UPI00243534E4|nr:decaprenyl-phosphate phosphoribosyltransferase [Geotalea sp. SG265]
MKHLLYLIKLIRPTQWLKNLMLFFPPFLSGSLLTSREYWTTGLAAFFSFCCLASSLYIVNDLCDVKRDRFHPAKRFRPIPSGQVSVKLASVFALILFLTVLLTVVFVVPQLSLFLFLYGFATVIYSVWLKNFPVVDLFCISFGFLVRLESGGAVFRVVISEWLFLSVFFLSLFLGTGKRYAEQSLLGVNSVNHRASLGGYSQGLLDAILHVTAATVLVTYTMYSLTHRQLVYTVPLCAFGLFRYILRVKSGSSGDPTESLLKDIPLLLCSFIWVVLVGWSIYS